jgi:hypothetical protein
LAHLAGALLAHILFVLVFSVLSIGATRADMARIYVAWLPVPLATAVIALVFEGRRISLSNRWRFFLTATATMSGMILGLIVGPLISSPNNLALFRIAVIGSSTLAAVLTFLLLRAFVRAAIRR